MGQPAACCTCVLHSAATPTSTHTPSAAGVPLTHLPNQRGGSDRYHVHACVIRRLAPALRKRHACVWKLTTPTCGACECLRASNCCKWALGSWRVAHCAATTAHCCYGLRRADSQATRGLGPPTYLPRSWVPHCFTIAFNRQHARSLRLHCGAHKRCPPNAAVGRAQALNLALKRFNRLEKAISSN